MMHTTACPFQRKMTHQLGSRRSEGAQPRLHQRPGISPSPHRSHLGQPRLLCKSSLDPSSLPALCAHSRKQRPCKSAICHMTPTSSHTTASCISNKHKCLCAVLKHNRGCDKRRRQVHAECCHGSRQEIGALLGIAGSCL